MTLYTLELVCPDLKVQADVENIREAVRLTPGFGDMEFDVLAHRVIVSTASQDHGQEMIRRLSAAGFPPSEVKVTERDMGERPNPAGLA